MFVRGLLILCLVNVALGDLRMASRPRSAYLLVNQGTVPWKVSPWKGQMHYRYDEPSTFGYKGLEHQKRRNYDNFLRSNIDNEQDNRNFNTEDGKDHLPFRTLETSVNPIYTRYLGAVRVSRRQRIYQPPYEMSIQKTVKPGDSMLIPFRWNNPHASEMEVNIWIFDHGAKQELSLGEFSANLSAYTPIVVPIRKPSCSAEGHQDNIISFTVPSDFGSLGNKIPGFKGCNEDSKPMCTLQVYSHSVESRQYAIGFPIVIPGHNSELTTTDKSGIQTASKDPWLDLSGLRDICLPALDPIATIPYSKPRWARLISDVYNHAYQNSDYSPYSGQQPEYISKNLQASAINKMVVGNRGELGRSILTREQRHRLRHLRRLENRIYKNYESLANKVIQAVGNKMKTTGQVGVQQLANCFRCAETGSTNTNRQQTNTYIPSFQLSKDLIGAAKKLVPTKYAGLITDSGLVQIYVASLKDLLPFFYQSRNLGIIYQEAVVKSTISTMADTTNFKKQDAAGKYDGGIYASIEAKKKFATERGCPAECLFPLPKVPSGATALLQHEDAQVESALEEDDGWQMEDVSRQAPNPFGKSTWYCVVRYNRQQVSGPYADLNAAKAELNKLGANRRSQQMVCQITAAGGATHAPGQHSRPRGGFNSYWRRAAEHRVMLTMCKQNSKCMPNEPSAVKSLVATKNAKSWYCVAMINHRYVSKPYSDLKGAQAELNAAGAPSWRNRKMVCEMSKAGPKKDPHIVGGQWQVPWNNFSKYWRNWNDINHMNTLCSQNELCKSNGVYPAAAKDSWFCVPRLHKKKVEGPFPDMKSALTELNKQSGHRGNWQMICEMTKDGAKKDPHKVGGLNQGLARLNGFNTYWRNWRGIHRLNHMCNADASCRLNSPGAEVEKPLAIGSIGTDTTGKCAACIQFFGKKVHPLKKPHMTPLSKELVAKGGNFLPHNRANLADNPDNALLQISESAARRRRRSALIQNDLTDKQNKNKINSFHLKKVRQHMEYAELNDRDADASSFDVLDDVIPLPEDD